jgi:hypothetical protein
MTDTVAETTESTVTDGAEKPEKDTATLAIAMPPEFLALIKQEATDKKLSASRFALELLAVQLEYNLPANARIRRVGLSDEQKKLEAKTRRDNVSALMKLVQASGLSITELAEKLKTL